MQRSGDADRALARLLTPDQGGLLAILLDTFLTHQLGDGHHVRRHVARAGINQPPCCCHMRIPMGQHGFMGELVGEERQCHVIGAAELLLVGQLRKPRSA